jgi:Domain of unknown function (DUF397)
MTTQPSVRTFRKSSYSPVITPSCVEVAHHLDKVYVRDSKQPGHELVFSVEEWTAFIRGVKDGEFDIS